MAAISVKRSLQTYLSLSITVNPLLSPPGGLFISSPFEGRLNRDGGGRAYLRGARLKTLEKTMLSVLHKEPECKVEKLNYKKVGGHGAED